MQPYGKCAAKLSLFEEKLWPTIPSIESFEL